MAGAIAKCIMRVFQGMYKKKFAAEHANDAIPDDLEEFRDVPYANEAGASLAMDVYRPKAAAGSLLPTVVLVHGGGLFVGDRKMLRTYARMLARENCLVCVPQYRLLPEVNAFEQLADVCAGFSFVKQHMEKWGGNPDCVWVVSESAGSWLSVFALSMSRSEALCKAVGCAPPSIKVRALACYSGMFYTTRFDLLGLFYPGAMYGGRAKVDGIFDRMNPEDPALIASLPPMFLTSSDKDFIKSYTLRFNEALQTSEKPNSLLYYEGNRELTHAFPAIKPDLPESAEVAQITIDWFSSL